LLPFDLPERFKQAKARTLNSEPGTLNPEL
jgi:hypothetical protein